MYVCIILVCTSENLIKLCPELRAFNQYLNIKCVYKICWLYISKYILMLVI